MSTSVIAPTRRVACQIVLLAAALSLTGCTSVMLRQEARGVTRAYGDVLNQQMLLNVARLDNGHPAYALVIGTLNSKFKYGMSTESTGNISDTDGEKRTETRGLVNGLLNLTGRALENTANVVTGGTVKIGATGEASPDFQLIPLNNAEVASQYLKPVDDEVFYNLFEQGVPFDQLLRVLVARVEVKLPNGERYTYLNRVPETAPDDWVANTPAKHYADFLRLAAVMRVLQDTGRVKKGDSQSIFAPVVSAKFTKVTASDVLKAKASGLLYRETSKDSGVYQLGSFRSHPVFQIEKDEESAARNEAIRRLPECAELISTTAKALSGGLAVEKKGSFNKDASPESKVPYRQELRQRLDELKVEENDLAAADAEKLTKIKTERADIEKALKVEPSIRVVLRPFGEVMRAVSIEQRYFFTSMRNCPLVPKFERVPILQTRWEDGEKVVNPPLMTLSYAGKRYAVTDPNPQASPVRGSSPGTPATWNRDTFRLLVALGSQVTVDISKYQQQFLEVR